MQSGLRKRAANVIVCLSGRTANCKGIDQRIMQRRDDRELRELLVRLRDEHRALDDRIILLEIAAEQDQLLIKRLKKQKLQLKDRITAVEDLMTPDIIA